MTARTLVWLDTETTGLHPARRAWDIALIVRHPGEPDTEWQWYIHPDDLDLPNADPSALRIGGFWDRHPHAKYLRGGGKPFDAPKMPGVHRLYEVLPVIARETAKRAIILGSNPHFDIATLEPRLDNFSITPEWHYHPEDVPTLVKGWLLGRGQPLPAGGKSDDYCRAVGIDPDQYQRHSALGDCRLFRDTYDAVTPGGRVNGDTVSTQTLSST